MSEAPAPCAEYCKPSSAVNPNGRYLAGNSGYRGPGVGSRFGPVLDVADPTAPLDMRRATMRVLASNP